MKFVKNKFVLTAIAFIVWMALFDTNSMLMHMVLRKQINELRSSIDFYKENIAKDNFVIQKLKTPEGFIEYAREEYFMKYPNEEVYIVDMKNE